MKLNKFAAKAVSVLIAIMLVSSQNIFANIIINEDYTTTQTEYKNYTQSGSGGVFDVSGDNATLTVQNGVSFSSNTAQGSPAYGGAIEVSNRYSKVKIGSRVGFRYNKAEYGGAIDNFGNIEIGDNVLFSSNKSSSSGGAIYNDGTYNKAGIITIGSGAAFNTNEAAYGGAIYNFRGSDITFGDRATFAGNKSKRHGGAIYNEAVLTFGSNSVFQNNGAEEDGGGAIYNTADGEMIIGTNSMFLVNKSTSTGGAIYNEGTMTINSGASFINNQSTKSNAGAIYNSVIMNLGSNVTFTSNESAKSGGAIYNTGTITIGSGASFNVNKSTSTGGAIYNNAGKITIGSNAKFEGNESQSDGGAIYNTGGTINIDSNALFTVNKSASSGAAIYNSSGTITIGSGTVFQHNESSGGTIQNVNGGVITIGERSKFKYNIAKTISGGAIHNYGTITISSGTSFEYNESAKSGGAINNYGKIIIGSDAEFKVNKSTSTGGAIYSNFGPVTIGSNAKFEGNESQSDGGAIYGYLSKITLDSNAQFQSNKAINGGAIYNSGDPGKGITIGQNAKFKNNEAQTNGGAIYNDRMTTAIGKNAEFEGNEAANGGAIYNKDTLTIEEGALFKNNKASSNGGAIFNSSKTVTIGSNVKFEENESKSAGGAIFNYNDGTITIGSNAIFERNTSNNNLGGAIYNSGALTIEGSSLFKNNTTSAPGGAIYNAGTMNIGSNAVFEENNSDNTGGVIYNLGTAAIGGSAVFRNNTANQPGGVIYNYGTMTIDSNVLFENNQANNNGGVIYHSSGTTTIGDRAVFKNNTGQNSGGAIFNSSGTITIGSKTLFENNISTNNSGGAIYNNNNGTVTIGEGAVFKNNTAKSSGGAMSNYGTMTIGSNALFENNNSTNGTGGAIDNSKTMLIGEGAVFKNNTATVPGGSIFNNNNGILTIENGAKFTGNSTKYTAGGAIYNIGTLNLIANTKNIEFTGNKVSAGTANEKSNAVFSSGKMNLWAGKADIIFNDPIAGNNILYINGEIENYQDSVGTGKIVLNADMSGYTGDVYFYGGTIELGKNGTLFGSNNGIKNIDVDNATIKMANGKVANAEFGREGDIVSIRKELNLTVDADLENKEMDMALFWGWPIEGKVNVKEINIIKDSDKTTRIDFAELAGNNKVITVNKARSVLYSYDVKLDYGEIKYELDGNLFSGNGYYYTFTKNGFNPVTAAGAVSASVGGYATQSVVTGQAFASMDRQVAAKNQPTVAPKATNSKTTTNNTQNKKEDKKQAPKKDTKQQNKKTSYIQSSNLYVSAGDQIFAEPSKIERGAWLRPFILNETVKVGDTDVDNNLYGTLAGIDLPVKGDILASFYLGYAGSKQKAEEVKSNQTGYVLGATGMLIKDKWYAGLTLNMIFNKASVDTDDGTNDIDMNMFTIGAKAGYNYDIGKNWILEPNVTLMYGIVNCGSYETTLTKVDSQSVNNIMLEPQVKARWQLTNGWQPYGLLGYAANLSSKPTVKTEAGDLDLDSIGGYVEFGAGVNKDFLNTAWSCYAQITGRAAGRSGFEGNLGIKYKF